jgi:hypothetical protein
LSVRPNEPDPPIHKTIYLKVVKAPGGYQPFVLVEGFGGIRKDLLPIRETPALPTYKQAEELAIVMAWLFLDTFKTADGERFVSVLD